MQNIDTSYGGSMKKYLTAILIALTVLSLTSCRESNSTVNGNNTPADMRNAAANIKDDIERGVDDVTDGTIVDTDRNYNVDNYTANGTEMK